MKIKNINLKNKEEVVFFPKTGLDQVIDRKSGLPLDRLFYDMQEKNEQSYNTHKKNKVYTNYDEIGLVDGEETFETIATKMPSQSTFIYNKTPSIGNSDIYPDTSGLLTVVKGNEASRVIFKFEKQNYFVFGAYDLLELEKKRWSGWVNLLNKKVYTKFEQLGITPTKETFDEIVNKLPTNSELNIFLYSGYANPNIYPTTSGLLTVKKYLHQSRVSFTFEREDGYYVGFYHENQSPKFSGWINFTEKRFYTKFEQLGIVPTKETIEEFVNKMPVNSELNTLIYSGYANPDIYPSTSGLLTVKKYNHPERVSFRFEREDGYYVGFYNTTQDPKFSGWNNLLTE